MLENVFVNLQSYHFSDVFSSLTSPVDCGSAQFYINFSAIEVTIQILKQLLFRMLCSLKRQ